MLIAVSGINWVAPLLILACYGLVRYFTKPDQKEPDKNGINWSGWEAVGITVAIYLIAQIIGGILIFFITFLMGMSLGQSSTWLDNNSVGQFFLVLSVEAITVALLYGFLNRRKSIILRI
jgi:hypothetical protein